MAIFFFLADSPYIDSCFNLSTMATFFCPQGRDVQLYLETILSCWKVMTVLALLLFLLLEIVEPQRKKKKRKKGKAEQGTEAGESIHYNRMRISLFRENRRMSVRLKSCEIGQQT